MFFEKICFGILPQPEKLFPAPFFWSVFAGSRFYCTQTGSVMTATQWTSWPAHSGLLTGIKYVVSWFCCTLIGSVMTATQWTCWPARSGSLTGSKRKPVLLYPHIFLCTVNLLTRARICKRLWRPGIDSEESISPACVARRAGTKNRVLVPTARLGIDFWSPYKVYKYRLSTLMLSDRKCAAREHCCVRNILLSWK